MSFWTIVLVALIGAPMAGGMAMLMAIFGAAGLANANRDAEAWAVSILGVAACLASAAAFGAFGIVPAWRAWHGGAEDFAGGLASFVHWLAGTAIVAAVWFANATIQGRIQADMAAGRQATAGLRWLVTTFNLACFGMLAGWLAWPLVAWPLQGHFEWPDPRTGWLHTGETAAAFLAVMLAEFVIRKLARR